MVKNRVSIFIIVTCISTQQLNASWQSWADGQIQSTANSGGSIKTKVTTGLSGPSLRVRWSSLGNINPIHIEAPHASVGCNGIDIGFGSLSFLNFDELVDKLKGIAATAPAFAFKMAIDTVCSQCSTIMQDLEEIVNEINNFSLDACAVSQQLGNSIGKAIGENLQNTIGDGTYQDSLKADRAKTNNEPSFMKKGWNSLKSKASGLVGDAKDLFLKEKRMYGSLLNNARTELSASGGLDGKDFIEMARALVGDVLVYAPNNQDKTELLISNIQVEQFLKASLSDSDNVDTVSVKLFDEGGADVTDVISGALPVRKQVTKKSLSFNLLTNMKNQLNSIVNNFKNKQQLGADSKNLIATLPGNSYVALNLLTLDINEFTIDELAEYVLLENLYAQLKFILNETLKILGEYSLNVNPDDKEISDDIQRFKENIEFKLREVNELLPEKIKPLRIKLEQLNDNKETLLKNVHKAS